METPRQEKTIYELFWWSVLGKGVISAGEIAAALTVWFVPLPFIPAQSSGFVALYLFVRGVLKLVLIIALLRNQLWAYPSSLVVLALFVLYQLYQIITAHSILIVLLTLFDLVVIYFIWREYGIVREHLQGH